MVLRGLAGGQWGPGGVGGQRGGIARQGWVFDDCKFILSCFLLNFFLKVHWSLLESIVVALFVFLLGVVVEKAKGVLLEVLDALSYLSPCQLLEGLTIEASSATNTHCVPYSLV